MPDKRPSEPQQQQQQQQHHQQHQQPQQHQLLRLQQLHNLGPYDSSDKQKYANESCAKLMEDPRTRELVEKRQITFFFRHGQQDKDFSGAATSGSIYTFYNGSLYPVAHDGAFLASPSTLFEVACTDSEISKKINLRPQLDLLYDAERGHLLFALDLPGFDNRDIKVETENGCLFVCGGCPRDYLACCKVDSLVKERDFGYFYRVFQLPPNAIEDEIRATLEAGVLYVRIPTSGAERKRVDIK